MEFDDSGFVRFTRGVWSADGAVVYSQEAHKTIVDPDGLPPNQERAANLALIAQAPVMYDLLKDILASDDELEDRIVPVLKAARIMLPQPRTGI